MTTIKQRILSGDAVYGCWINMGSPVSAEIIGRAGFDWVLIDLEHGAGDVAIMYQQLQVLENTGATALVRTDELSRGKIQRILDAGAGGIMFPQLQTPEEAAQAVQFMYYPPKGIRGMAKNARATGFGRNADGYIANLEKNLITVVQVETIEAVNNIDAICATAGLDVLFVGPADLTLAYGIFGQLDHPQYQQAIKSVAMAAQKHGKAAGVLLQNADEYQMYYELGYRFLACGAESNFVSTGADEMIKLLKAQGRAHGN